MDMLNRKVFIYSYLLVLIITSTVGIAAPTPDAANVARAYFTTEVVDREPLNQVLVLGNQTRKLLFFTELRHLEGQTVYHQWEHQGKLVSRVPFEVKGPRWRVYSAVDLEPDQLGTWTAIVTDEQGWPLKAAIFEYTDTSTAGSEEVILPVNKE